MCLYSIISYMIYSFVALHKQKCNFNSITAHTTKLKQRCHPDISANHFGSMKKKFSCDIISSERISDSQV